MLGVFLQALQADRLQALFGLQAASRPDVFCYAMTIASSGVAYVAAVWCVYRLAKRVGKIAR